MSPLSRVMLLTIALAFTASACRSDDPPSSDAMPTDQGRPDRGPQPDIEVGPPVEISVGTFNVRNFFDATDDPEKEDDVLSESAIADKISELGAAIRELDVDILALQEIENLQLVERLRSDELSSMGYSEVRLVEGNDIRGIDVALLSRHPVVNTTSHANDHFDGVDAGDTKTHGFSRDCLEVVVEPSPARRLVLLINHLRASDRSNPEEALWHRHAQAARVRDIANSTLDWDAEANLAVLGDLNDSPDSRTLTLLKDGEPALVDLHGSLTMNERYTNVYQGDRGVLDYILASPGLVADLEAGSARARHDSVFSATSDHFPVVATFTLR